MNEHPSPASGQPMPKHAVAPDPDRASGAPSGSRLWDLPLRLFHWALAAAVAAAITTVKLGGALMPWHQRAGYVVLFLLVFRVLWGLAGSTTARFDQFVRSPATAWRYLRGRAGTAPGHNPLGAYAVLALLAAFGVQATTGLFADDEIGNTGPLAALASARTAGWLNRVHHLNEPVLYALVALHLGAIAYYRLRRGDDLVGPMLSGERPGLARPATEDDAEVRGRALVLAGVSAALVGYLANL